MSIQENITKIKETTKNFDYTLVAVSKTKPIEVLQEAYDANQRVFGENKVQELCEKYEALPKDIEWHMIGHLQSNKVEYIAAFISLVHAVDSVTLLKKINKRGGRCNRTVAFVIQIHIAKEESKFGFSFEEAEELLNSNEFKSLDFIEIKGFMGMATNTDNEAQVTNEFKELKTFSEKYPYEILSMGMSGDYQIALKNGSTMIRVGSSIFGHRNYNI